MLRVNICSIFILVAPEESHSSSMGDLDEFLEDESTVSSIATKNYDIRSVFDPSLILLARAPSDWSSHLIGRWVENLEKMLHFINRTRIFFWITISQSASIRNWSQRWIINFEYQKYFQGKLFFKKQNGRNFSSQKFFKIFSIFIFLKMFRIFFQTFFYSGLSFRWLTWKHRY